MNIFDFLTQDELDAAPDDPAMAFVNLVSIAQRRLRDHCREYDENESNGSFMIDDANYDFENIVIGLAKTYRILPFSEMKVPLRSKFGYDDRRQFKADLDHYMTQLVVGNTLRMKRDVVPLAEKAHDRIRSHIAHLKSLIDKATITEAQRATLHAKLREFEATLDKDRVSIFKFSRAMIELISVSANILTIADSSQFQKLVSNVTQSVAECKATDDSQRQIPPHEPPPALTPPRDESLRSTHHQAIRRETFSADLDDEIPF